MMNGLTRTLCTVVVTLAALVACGEPASEPEAELRAWVATGIESAENKQRRDLMSMVSPAYADARGKEKGDIENMLRVYFLRQHSIALLPKINEITIYDDTAASVDLTVGLAGTNDGVLGFSADAYRFELELEKDGDEWVLISARWGELGGEIK
ncbi:MAG: hypothetical protein EX272_07675 [Chromatiales bacterium]|nr:MAG: hypothetical protein EX272_07675 [Chromatiales bacterium]